MTLNTFGLYLFLTLTVLFSAIAVCSSVQPVYIFANSRIKIDGYEYGSDEHDLEVKTCINLAILSLILFLLLIMKIPMRLQPYLSDPNSIFTVVPFLLILLALVVSLLSLLLRDYLHISRNRHSIRPLHCGKCEKQLKKFHRATNFLNSKEQIAVQIGSVYFEAWQCKNCFPTIDLKSIHLRAYHTDDDRFQDCNVCNELTMQLQSSQVLKKPTTTETGKKLNIYKCQSCFKIDKNMIELPVTPDIAV